MRLRKRNPSVYSEARAIRQIRERGLAEMEARRLAAMTPEEQAARKAKTAEWMLKWLDKLAKENAKKAAHRESERQRLLEEASVERMFLRPAPPRWTKIEVKAR